MRQAALAAGDITLPFQSSPGLEAGCDGDEKVKVTVVLPFQSSPGLDRVRREQRNGEADLAGPVSILTRLGGRVRRRWAAHEFYRGHVSILTRLGGRVRQSPVHYQRCCLVFQSSPGLEAGCDNWAPLCTGSSRSFNPHPAWRPGATSAAKPIGPLSKSFNPHPAWRPGATEWGRVRGCWLQVSILTRLGGRVRPDNLRRLRAQLAFQSSPGLEAGCDAGRLGGQ